MAEIPEKRIRCQGGLHMDVQFRAHCARTAFWARPVQIENVAAFLRKIAIYRIVTGKCIRAESHRKC